MKTRLLFAFATLQLITLSSSAQLKATFRLDNTADDAPVSSYYPTSAFTDEPAMGSVAWTIDGVPYTNRTYIKFPTHQIPSNIEVVSAKLSLFYGTQNTLTSPGGGHSSLTNSNESVIHRVTDAWSEQYITWENQPAVDESVDAYLTESTDHFQDYTDIDVTDLVKASFEAKDYDFSFRLKLVTEEKYAALLFGSSEDSIPEHRPLLEITYNECTCNSINKAFGNDPNLSLSPNPSNGIFNIKGITNYNQLTVRDLTGKLILEIPLNGNTTQQIDISSAETGTYFLTLSGANGTSSARVNKL